MPAIQKLDKINNASMIQIITTINRLVEYPKQDCDNQYELSNTVRNTCELMSNTVHLMATKLIEIDEDPYRYVEENVLFYSSRLSEENLGALELKFWDLEYP
eukprot:CAMPEP_0114579858 /NCGR_PEP_ID=MMETSP0125-20121206/4213_1 /TAXON_ID=485358 ORGANISM="Aristerostoma sp., Strain ATCC 50986" /NCGR_SAMPLE_ID=MMETSP0125 /ASSEMBLY_ACC=CAM_ASM_000245 /LENGTH=101 /DNA_ID=CAMNT_0001770979 /DNA_START=3313 /DNA_END=3618 /DNA_ORIENTATION=+